VETLSAGPGSAAPARRQLFRLKPVDAIVAQREEDGEHGLRPSMSLLQLTALSIGATLGTGIFVILGEAVPLAGPAVALGFVLAAVTALFSALSYAELAGTIPVSGSSYFSYIGFDAASTAGDEARDPRRDLPRAIMLSLLVVTIVYCLVALAAVGAVPWPSISGSEAALADVLALATGQTWTAVLVSIGAVIAIASVVLTVLYGQTRILYAMSRDGLVPPVFSRVSRRRRIPVANTVIVGVVIALLAGLVPLGELANATSIGTLFAFALVNVGIVLLRRTRQDLPRTFRTPLYPLTPVLGVLVCVLLMVGLGTETRLVFLAWMLVGLAVYAGYGHRHSALRTSADTAPPAGA
jgi:APA family basic amino acid/polyamine antiporter